MVQSTQSIVNAHGIDTAQAEEITMKHFTQLRSVPVVFLISYPTLHHAAGSSSNESSSSSLHLIAAAFVGLCFAMPVLWKTAKTFLGSRSQKVKSIKNDDTPV